MKLRMACVWAACFGMVLAAAAVVLFTIDASLGSDDRAALRRALAASTVLLVVLAAFAWILTGFLANWLTQHYFASARRLTESIRLAASGNPSHRAEPDGPAELRELAEAINSLAARHEESLKDVTERIARAQRDLNQEKTLLAALMSELAQSVIVCNAEGRILLYNSQARRLFTRPEDLAGAPAPAFVGLGRSLFALLDQDVVSHALEQLRHRLAQGEVVPATTFIAATRTGRLVRAQMAPVAGVAEVAEAGPAADNGLAGFVLLLEDIDEDIMRADRRDQLLPRLTEIARASLAGIRAAAENLVNYPEMDAARRRQFTGIISHEADHLTAELARVSREHSEHVKSRWLLEQMPAADLLDVIRRRIEMRVGLAATCESAEPSLWLNVESFTLVQALCYLARRLKDEVHVREVRLSATTAGRHACLDLIWAGPRLPAATVREWENAPLNTAGEPSTLTFREVCDRHHGETWYESDKVSPRSWFRVLLPPVEPGKDASLAPALSNRPEYYDFDLFHQPGQTRELDDRSLREIAYTVFDTETTGLDPSAGDEIISIGAVRIVNGRLLKGEVFEQLVDPRRALRAASIKIHGIQAERLEGQPTIERVLPAFFGFCAETVLVGHNAAFDMRFLHLKEETTGVRFTQPVMDTLLLSAVLHGNLVPHQLEAIAERFGVEVVDRHTAVGDAITTGQVFLKMIPLLAARGIVTLKQARDACERTYYARLRY